MVDYQFLNYLFTIFFIITFYKSTQYIPQIKIYLYTFFNQTTLIEHFPKVELSLNKPLKYEDKYNSELKKLDKEFQLNDVQIELKNQKYIQFCNEYNDEFKLLLNETHNLIIDNESQLIELLNELSTIKLGENTGNNTQNENETETEPESEPESETETETEPESESESETESETESESESETETETESESKINELNKIIDKLNINKTFLLNKIKQIELYYHPDNIVKYANNKAIDFVYDLHFKNFINNICIEKTPLGNVLMFYNNDKKAFQYYSDNSIPYKYLDVVARKYVILFKCRCIYIDMTDELKLYKPKAIESKAIESKSIYAQFKNYNKSASSYDKSAMVAPAKNNIVRNNNTCVKKEVYLKDNSNHYINSGKIVNFNFLKTVKREPQRSITYKDFKQHNIML
jgi:hypothetical protein